MGLFSSNKESKNVFPWIPLKSLSQLNLAFENSLEKPFLLFKHSTRCSISSMVITRFQNNWSTEKNLCDLYYIDLIEFRSISNEIEKLTGVVHQSPQAIVIKSKKVVYEDSHTSINASEIEKRLNT